MIRICTSEDTTDIYKIINEAAAAYSGHIPADCYHQPYMTLAELQNEMQRMILFGWEEQGVLVGVMGMEPIKDVTLVRHAYVLTDYQGQGIGSKLIKHIEEHCPTERLLVGTWRAATWATAFYARHGFEFMADKDRLLNAYWAITPRQTETSVVLGKRMVVKRELQEN